VKNRDQRKVDGILVYTTGDFPYGMAPESLVRHMALGFKENNVRIKVVRLRGQTYMHANDTGIEASNFLFRKKTTNDFIKLIELIALIILSPFSIIYNRLRYRYNVTILYGVEYFYQILPFWFACKLTRSKLIRITTDFYRESTVVPVWWKKPKLFFYLFQYKYFDKFLDGIVSLSSYMSDYAKINGVNPDKVLIIPHFVDTDRFCQGYSLNQSDDKFRVGFCGTVVEPNGIFELIDAFKIVNERYPNTELLIIGEPWVNERERIKKQIGQFESSIKVTGLLSPMEVPAAMLSCNVLVNPRKSSLAADAGFPTKIAEYFATGLPVISTPVGDIKFYFTNQVEILLVKPDDPEAIAEAIIFVIENKAKALEIGKKGFEWAEKHLNHKSNARKILNFIIES
jgi:glycosyltransferase involved in cell wall biosynthesis